MAFFVGFMLGGVVVEWLLRRRGPSDPPVRAEPPRANAGGPATPSPIGTCYRTADEALAALGIRVLGDHRGSRA